MRQDDETSGLRFGLLGRLRVTRDGTDCCPRPPKQQALLAMLALRRREVVPSAVLIDGLWGFTPPQTALAALQGYISAVRRRLGPAPDARTHPVVRTEPCGYVLDIPADRIDLYRFTTIAADARRLAAQGCLRQAHETFDRALALWRGPLLAGQRIDGVLEAAAVRWDEERLGVLEARCDVGLRLGRAGELIGELEELCRLYPLRETFHERLMAALVAAGRPAEALAAYARARRGLADEAGVEPGARLRQVHQDVLRGGVPAPLSPPA